MLRNRRAIGSRGVGQLHALRQHAGLQIEIRPRAVELQPSEPDGLPQDASGYVAEYHLRVAQAVGRDFPRLRKKQPVTGCRLLQQPLVLILHGYYRYNGFHVSGILSLFRRSIRRDGSTGGSSRRG